MEQTEIGQLRREERFKDIGNRVGDAVAYDLQAAPSLTRAVRDAAVAKAVRLYGSELPAGIIAALIDVQVARESEARQRAEALRRQKIARGKRRGLLSKGAM